MIVHFFSIFSRRIFFFALPMALGLLLLFPTIGLAHAILLRSDPEQNATLTSAPGTVHMWFSENLNPASSKAVILMSNQHLADSTSAVSSSDTKEMDITLQNGLPAGAYLVVWHTLSADDGHILSGSFQFSVENPDGTVPKQSISPTAASTLLGNTTGNQFDTSTLFSTIMITLVDLAAIFWVGAQLWHTFILDNEAEVTPDQQAEQRFQQHFSLPTLLVILLANVGILLGQSLSIGNGQLNQAFSITILHNLIATGRFGTYWTMRQIVVFLAILVSAYSIFSPRRPRQITSLLPSVNLFLGMLLLIAVTLSGDATAASGNALIFSVLIDWLHLLAASLWIGGMLYLSLIYLPVLQKLPAMERTRALLALIPSFSPLAITGIIIMAVTGPFNATFHMTSPNQLLDTAYGRTLLIKSTLVGAMLVVSGIYLGLFQPRLKKDYKKYAQETQESGSAETIKQLEQSIISQTQRLTTTLRWEPLLGVAVLVCAGLLNVFAGTLASTNTTSISPVQPSQPTATVKAYTSTLTTSDTIFTIKLSVSPNRLGPNVFTVTALDSTGKVKNKIGVTIYTTMLDMDMGTNSISLQPDGKGNFVGNGELDMGGNWQLRVQLRTPDAKLHEATVKIVASY
jgi:copper transport protein